MEEPGLGTEPTGTAAVADPETPEITGDAGDPGNTSPEGGEEGAGQGEAGETGEGGEEGEVRGGKKGGVQKRISELVAERENAKFERDFYKAELERARTATPAAPEPEADPAPDRNNYTDPYDYAEAVADWKVRQIKAEQEAIKTAETRKAQAETFNSRVAEVTDAGKKKYQDYEAVAFNGVLEDATKQNSGMVGAILNSPLAADVAYHLSKNPAEAKKMASMTPGEAYRAIGRLEATLQAKAQPAPRAPGAPAPVPTLGGGSGGDTEEDIASFMQRENERERSQRRK